MLFNRALTPEERLGIDLADAEVDLIEQLIAVRKYRGLSQADVAEAMNVDRSVVNRFEKAVFGAKRPNMTTVRRYAVAVNAYIAPLVATGENYKPLQAILRNNLDTLKKAGDSIAIERGTFTGQTNTTPKTTSSPWHSNTSNQVNLDFIS